MGPKNILGLKLMTAVARRYLEDRLLTMGPLTQEVFKVFLLNGAGQIRATEDLFNGTLDQSVVYPREVLAQALSAGAAAVVCAHNHPSGESAPSASDREITRRLYHACRAAGVEFLDHLVVGRRDVYGFAQNGDLAG